MGFLDNITSSITNLKGEGITKIVDKAMAFVKPTVDEFVKKYGIDVNKANVALAKVKDVVGEFASGKLTLDGAKKELRGPVFNSLLAAASTTNKAEELTVALQGKLKQGKFGKFFGMLPSSITDNLTGEITNMQQRLVSQLEAKNTVAPAKLATLPSTDVVVADEVIDTEVEVVDKPAVDNFERHDNGVVVITEVTTEEQDEAFIDSLMNVKAPTAATPLQTGQAAMEAVSSLMTMSNEVMKFTEVQKTKRTQINAEKEVALARINATSQLLADYLQKTNDERSSIFKKQFEVIDHALKSGNVQELALTLNAMNDLAKSSPFKNLADIGQVKNMLQDNSTEFDF